MKSVMKWLTIQKYYNKNILEEDHRR